MGIGDVLVAWAYPGIDKTLGDGECIYICVYAIREDITNDIIHSVDCSKWIVGRECGYGVSILQV